MARAKLIDNRTGAEYELKSRVTRIGRKEDNDIVIRSRLASKYHMEVRSKLTGFFIADVGSTHGFYVNNHRVIEETRLNSGDQIRILIIFADEEPGADTEKGTSTFIARPQAVAKPELTGKEENVSLGCDFTFKLEGEGIFSKLGGALSRK